MSVPVREAAEAIAPLLSVGGDAALRQLAGDAGEAVAGAAVRVVEKLRALLGSDRPSVLEIEDALRAGLSEGSVDEADVRVLASLEINQGDQFNIKGSVTIGRDYNSRSVVNNFDGKTAE